VDLAVLPALEGLLPRFNDEDIVDGNDIDSHNALVGEFGVVGDITRDLRGAGCYNTIKWISTCEKGGEYVGGGLRVNAPGTPRRTNFPLDGKVTEFSGADSHRDFGGEGSLEPTAMVIVILWS